METAKNETGGGDGVEVKIILLRYALIQEIRELEMLVWTKNRQTVPFGLYTILLTILKDFIIKAKVYAQYKPAKCIT